jgi:polyhydroxyalkanoate synthase
MTASNPHGVSELAATLDRKIQTAMAALTGGLSPASLALAMTDWAWHLTGSPGTLTCLALACGQCMATAADPEMADDPRFNDEAWKDWPFQVLKRLHFTRETWWNNATQLRGMEHHHQDVMHFLAHQWLGATSPSNVPWLNPVVIKTTMEKQGQNLLQGAALGLQDWQRTWGLQPLPVKESAYRPGIEVACTPGQIVHSNHLIELIQYTPQTVQVQREPILIVPSWIMKYYILDLSPANSLVKYLVEQGHTVFMVSWRNPDESDALLDMQDYLKLGVLNPLAVITERTGGAPIHTAGYCLGGTLLAIAAAALARPHNLPEADTIAPLATMTLLAAQLDFRDPGDLGVFLDEAQVALLEDTMAEKGFLSGQLMGSSFQLLKPRHVFWSALVGKYALGIPDIDDDLTAWNADVTRMPASMHSQYLHKFYLHNELAEGQFEVDDEPVSLEDIHLPIFAVGTLKDHVTPWESAYKVMRLTRSDVTFVLTSGGHNAGVLSVPGQPFRRYQKLTTQADTHLGSPEGWRQKAPTFEGSWWPEWHAWLVRHSSETVPAEDVAPAQALGPAPGQYVRVRYKD